MLVENVLFFFYDTYTGYLALDGCPLNTLTLRSGACSEVRRKSVTLPALLPGLLVEYVADNSVQQT